MKILSIILCALEVALMPFEALRSIGETGKGGFFA